MAETAVDFAQALRREILRSEQQRMRVLAALTKETGARLLLSEAMRKATDAGDAIDLGPLAIRGCEQPVRVWRLP